MLGKIELVEVRAHRLRGEAVLSEIGDRCVAMALRELLPVRPEDEAMVDHLGELSTDGARDPSVNVEVRTVIGAPDDVGDREIEIVHHGRELVRRASIGSQERGSAV